MFLLYMCTCKETHSGVAPGQNHNNTRVFCSLMWWYTVSRIYMCVLRKMWYMRVHTFYKLSWPSVMLQTLSSSTTSSSTWLRILSFLWSPVLPQELCFSERPCPDLMSILQAFCGLPFYCRRLFMNNKFVDVLQLNILAVGAGMLQCPRLWRTILSASSPALTKSCFFFLRGAAAPPRPPLFGPGGRQC